MILKLNLQRFNDNYNFQRYAKVNGTQDITSNGTYDVANKEKVNVNVESGASLLDITATFKVEDSNYQITSIKSGNQIQRPFINPSITGKVFQDWYDSATGGNVISFPYAPSGDVDIFAHMVEGKIMTVSGLGSSSPSSVTFDVPSDFKFTDGEYVDADGNVFVKIPKMYRKVNTVTNNQITSFSISNAKIDDNYKIYPVFLAEDGVTELDWVGIGKYMSKNSNKVDSVASGSVTQMTLGNARTNIKNNYSYGKYQLYDWMFHKLWQDLIICKMQTINTNSGSGITTDQLGIYWGNVGQWIDGFGHVDNYVYLCDKPSKYVDSPTASSDGYFTTNYRILSSNISDPCISKLGYDEMHPFVTLPVSTTSNSSYNTYYCDYYYYNSGNRQFLCLAGPTAKSNGVFDLRGNYDWSASSGVRLCYRPLGN